jgi:hypothetical protein
LYYDDYRKQLKVLASHGDKSAQEALRRSDDILSFMKEKKLERLKKQLEEYDCKHKGV